MRTIKLTLEYDGTEYVGWQRQPNGLSIQQIVEEALGQVLQASVRLHSSGRTDAGVHARGMIAHFRTDRNLPLSAFREGVNRYLPRDIAIRAAEEAAENFHSRFDARGKWYRYTLYLNQVPSPLQWRYSWHIRGSLDLQAMADAARGFVGLHDFSAFRTAGCEARSTEKEIYSFEILREGDLVHLDVKGSGFLRNMVRVMVGTLVEIGFGKRPASDVGALLAAGSGISPGATAPPQGLCLMEVWY
ncbi:MAG: tRNA pseudouridine(38-40) synthase TruA [Syntrophotaleaceae bacterium]